MQVRFGRTIPDGFLPVFSVDTEDEARTLIVLACQRDDSGQYYARELAAEQSRENLQRFSDRLAEAWKFLLEAQARKTRKAKSGTEPGTQTKTKKTTRSSRRQARGGRGT